MEKLFELLQIEFENITNEDVEKSKELINTYGLDSYISALIKASYNNLKNIVNVEKILKENLYEKEQISLDEILSANATEYTKLVEDRFERKLSLIEKYLLNKSCKNFSLEDINKALNDERLNNTYTIHRVVEILNNL